MMTCSNCGLDVHETWDEQCRWCFHEAQEPKPRVTRIYPPPLPPEAKEMMWKIRNMLGEQEMRERGLDE